MQSEIKKFLAILIFLSMPVIAQEAYNWKNYSSQQNINAVKVLGNDIWAGTDGGVFKYSASDSSYFTLNKADGLSGASVLALTIDNYGKVWSGAGNGGIDVYDPSSGTANKILDIYNTDRSMKSINQLLVKGDTIIVATDFGLSLINCKTLNFYDTYFKLGNLPAYSKVNNVIYYQGKFYVATANGVAVQKDGAVNLNAPDSWNSYTTTDGLPVSAITKIQLYKGAVMVGSAKGLSVLSAGRFTTFNASLANTSITDFITKGDTVFAVYPHLINTQTFYTLVSILNGSIATIAEYLPEVHALTSVEGNSFTIGTNSGIYKGGVAQSGYYYPNGPTKNMFTGMSLSPNGSLWVTTGTDVSGNGFYKYSKNVWTNYTPSNTPIIKTPGYFSTFSSTDGNTYLGSWGKGFIRVSSSGVIDTFYIYNTPLTGLLSAPKFCVITAFGNDSKGNLWILNYDAADRKVLLCLTTDNKWYTFENATAPTAMPNMHMVVDAYNTKWYSSDAYSGVFYLNENGTFSTTTDDKAGRIYTGTESPLGYKTLSMAIDNRGDLWVGTSLGVSILSGTNSILSNTKPRNTSVYALRQQQINAIAVDPINRKWIGTNQGLILVDADGNNVLASYDSKNSPLVSDEVGAITIDPKDGTVYVSQNGAIVTFHTMAFAPSESYSSLTSYPSPFRVGKNTALTIDGLIKDSEIKIFDISGNLIRTLTTPGGRIATWDGRDDAGQLVGSGVYIMVANQSDAKQKASAKIAVIKE